MRARFYLSFLFAILAPLAPDAVRGDRTAIAVAASGPGGAGIECDRCHGSAEFLAGKGASPERATELLVPSSLLAGSKHADLECADCHWDFDAFPHPPTAETVSCEECHDEPAEDWGRSVHAANGHDGASCVTCHSAHRVLGPEIRESRIHPLNEAALCGSCHGDPEFVAEYFTDPADSVARIAVETYHETVHGLGLGRSGLLVSATCSDCHGAHAILRANDPASSVHHDRIPETCGKCHLGIVETYGVSAHGKAFAERAARTGQAGPVCTDCHASHGIAPPDAAWKAGVVDECGACHQRLYETYLETYHGKVTHLGGQLVAKCSDCHTAHANLPAADPESSVHPANLRETCAKCHEKAPANFVGYRPHGDPHDRENYPELYWPWALMSSLLVGVFSFFGIHTVLWLNRALVERGSRNEPATGESPGASTNPEGNA